MQHLTAYRAEIERQAARRAVDPDVIEAMVLQESGGRAWAWNPEPRYRWLWDVRQERPFRSLTPADASSKWPPSDFPALGGDRDQEWWGQQASWGLLQVMGAVARERGCRALYLTELCDPVLGLQFGVAHFAALLRLAAGDTWKAVGMYNAGPGGWDSGPARVHIHKVQGFYAQVTGRAR